MAVADFERPHMFGVKEDGPFRHFVPFIDIFIVATNIPAIIWLPGLPQPVTDCHGSGPTPNQP